MARVCLQVLLVAGLTLCFEAIRDTPQSAALADRQVHAESIQSRPRIADDRLEAGDLVFRLGRSFGSQAVMSVDPKSAYSHVGILARGADAGWYVIHVMPEAATDVSRVRFELLDEFVSTAQAQSYAVFRFHGVDEEQVRARAVENARRFYDSGVTFDSNFDLTTDDAMYCTELVWKAYLGAGVDLVDGKLDALEGPFFSGLFILPSTLQKSAALEAVE
jgi:hypothetical protein